MTRTFKRAAAALPPVAFTVDEATGATIMIRRGEPKHYHIASHFTADELNRLFGVTPAQVEAMRCGSMFGWDSFLADPASYGEAPSGISTNDWRLHR